jgi:hypothetical protein
MVKKACNQYKYENIKLRAENQSLKKEIKYNEMVIEQVIKHQRETNALSGLTIPTTMRAMSPSHGMSPELANQNFDLILNFKAQLREKRKEHT